MTINASTDTSGPGANALYTESVQGNSNNLILNGTNHLTTTVSGGAAIYETSGANEYNALNASGSILTGSDGWVGSSVGQMRLYLHGYSLTMVANGTHVTGLSLSAPQPYIDSTNAQGTTAGSQLNISGFDTGISLVGYGGGTIAANTTGIAATDQGGGPVTITSGHVGRGDHRRQWRHRHQRDQHRRRSHRRDGGGRHDRRRPVRHQRLGR